MIHIVNVPLQTKTSIDFTQSATNNHTRQKETGGNKSAVGHYGPEVPDTYEHNHLVERAHYSFAENITNDSTFGLPEEGSKWVKSVWISAPPSENS